MVYDFSETLEEQKTFHLYYYFIKQKVSNLEELVLTNTVNDDRRKRKLPVERNHSRAVQTVFTL